MQIQINFFSTLFIKQYTIYQKWDVSLSKLSKEQYQQINCEIVNQKNILKWIIDVEKQWEQSYLSVLSEILKKILACKLF